MTASIKVLVVDDHAIVRDGLMQLLRTHAGFEPVGCAASGSEALEKAIQLRPEVIILDVALPDIDGIQVATRIHSALPDTAIVMLSMHSGSDFMIRALEAGALGYVLRNRPARRSSTRCSPRRRAGATSARRSPPSSPRALPPARAPRRRGT